MNVFALAMSQNWALLNMHLFCQCTVVWQIQKVWQIRQKHMVWGLLSQYFFLAQVLSGEWIMYWTRCAFLVHWWSYIPPFSNPRPSQPLGNPHCSKCESQCWSHFLDPEKAITSALLHVKNPPSQLLKEAFDYLKGHVGSEEYILQTTRECLLSLTEVRIWFENLTQIWKNRKRGAKRQLPHIIESEGQVPTRTQPNTQEQANTHEEITMTFCGVCHELYVEVTEELEG